MYKHERGGRERERERERRGREREREGGRYGKRGTGGRKKKEKIIVFLLQPLCCI